MAFLRRLFGGGAEGSDKNGLHLYVKCNRCGSPVHVRLDLNNDLSENDGESDDVGYSIRKELMDDRCFRVMVAELQFDSRRNETSRELQGGTFISEAEYEELRAQKSPAQ